MIKYDFILSCLSFRKRGVITALLASSRDNHAIKVKNPSMNNVGWFVGWSPLAFAEW
jgi:hypothetical protein